jgi:hypothetical protein
MDGVPIPGSLLAEGARLRATVSAIPALTAQAGDRLRRAAKPRDLAIRRCVLLAASIARRMRIEARLELQLATLELPQTAQPLSSRSRSRATRQHA